MNRKSTEKLRMDRRLIERNSWISRKDLDREIAALPDVTHKIRGADDDKESVETVEPGDNIDAPPPSLPDPTL